MKVSQRLLDIVSALPLKDGMRILEIGCGPGVAAREIVRRFESCYVLALDRSAKAIAQATGSAATEITQKKIRFIQSTIEEFELPSDELPFDLAFAVRVGALDGRHPEIEKKALQKISKALKPGGKLFIDGEAVLREISLS